MSAACRPSDSAVWVARSESAIRGLRTTTSAPASAHSAAALAAPAPPAAASRAARFPALTTRVAVTVTIGGRAAIFSGARCAPIGAIVLGAAGIVGPTRRLAGALRGIVLIGLPVAPAPAATPASAA